MTARCSNCGTLYAYDTCRDYFPGTNSVETEADGRKVYLSLCRCGAVIAVQVQDEFGETLYLETAYEDRRR